MHVHSSGWSHTRLHFATMLFADTDCCTRTYVYTLPRLRTSQRVNYTTVLQYMKSHSYPKFISISKVYYIISSGSSTGAQKPRKLSVPARIAAKLHTGQFAREGSKTNFDQLDLSEGPLFLQTFYTTSTPSANTKSHLHRSAAADPVPVGHTSWTHGDFA